MTKLTNTELTDKHYICDTDQLNNGDCFSFSAGERYFLVKKDDELFAYRNSCPHLGAELEHSDNKFLDRKGKYIQCSIHGALFDIPTGQCHKGPCYGEYLTTKSIIIENGKVYMAK